MDQDDAVTKRKITQPEGIVLLLTQVLLQTTNFLLYSVNNGSERLSPNLHKVIGPACIT